MATNDTAAQPSPRLLATARIAFAAFLHDLGKFAERSRVFAGDPRLDSQKQLVCPHKVAASGGTYDWTHVHAAYTGLALDHLEAKGLLPPMVGDDVAPFGAWGRPGETDDSLNNAAAMHHKPGTMLQWVVATADRVASGFERADFEAYNKATERGNHYTARLLTQFAQLQSETVGAGDRFAYPLRPLSVAGLCPQLRANAEPPDNQAAQLEYRRLWDQFVGALGKIAPGVRADWPRWLDAFDSAWLCYTNAIPSATAGNTRPDVSLYDHSKAAAALAAAIWRFHNDNDHDMEAVRRDLHTTNGAHGWAEHKILLIQGDFFGIQGYVFGDGAQTQKFAAKLLRGRSFSVALLTELAALAVLEALDLPATSQIVNAAGKFLIVAPNTDDARSRLEGVRFRLAQWFAEHTLGQQGVGLATVAARLDEFRPKAFATLLGRLAEALELQKLQRHSLCSGDPTLEAALAGYHDRCAATGVCAVDGRMPGEATAHDPDGNDHRVSRLAKAQIEIGRQLLQRPTVEIRRAGRDGAFDWLGYKVRLTGAESVDVYGALRVWDLSGPEAADQPLFHGWARRFVNTYVCKGDDDGPLAFDKLAGQSAGLQALGVLKGDVDNLGALFQQGLAAPTFAKWAGLSRQMHAFFAVVLPQLCSSDPRFESIYTVFAGGDDFFLLGPWDRVLELAGEMRNRFSAHVAHNGAITFCAGFVLVQPATPVRHMAERAETALALAKARVEGNERKDALCAFGRTVSWARFGELWRAHKEIDAFVAEHAPSSGYLYSLLRLSEQSDATSRADKANCAAAPADWLWRARFAYRTQRVFRARPAVAAEANQVFGGALTRFKGDYRVALCTYLYKKRS
ncbi:MAG: type III-A CRISPR-associated protein Cas10/Csm1 [Deltaproteobacteria bacterium]|nr:type III-A CRISPR-associated protein Cas10/Csm1 [Deltaproteobacteria bacterium]